MDDAEINRLFIAIPQLAFKPRGLQRLLEAGIISREQYEGIQAHRRAYRKAGKVMDELLDNKGIVDRILAVAPELMTVEMINILRYAEVIDEATGHALRIAVRSVSAITGPKKVTLARRMFNLLDVQLSHERIDLWHTMGWIDDDEAEHYRGLLTTGKQVVDRIDSAIQAKTLLDALMILGQIPMDEKSVRGLVRAGLMSAKTGNAYIAAMRAGVRQWKVFEGARRAEGLAARIMLTLTGTLNSDMLLFLKRIGVIDNQQRALLEIAAQIAHRVNQKMLEDLTARRFRVLPGEAPIKTFAKASRTSEADILRLLAKAAKESRREAKILAAKGQLRADQYNIQARALHLTMRKMWEGVGYLSIFGESEVAEAAAESVAAMQNRVIRNLPDELVDSLLWQAKSGVDSYISREENTLPLSRRVYKNMDLYQGRVDERIKLGLLQGKSAEEIARSVHKFISPSTPGGVAFAARRLARTEINNAFHFSTIRYTRENPWVRGYKWNLSSSHGRPDECNRLASDDHDGLGPGVFKKTNVPGKPHPQCLCYITTVQMSEAEFIAASKAGRFNKWRKSIVQEQSAATYGADTLARAVTGYVGAYGLDFATGAVRRALR